MRRTKYSRFLEALLFTITYFARRNERLRQKTAIEIRLAKLLTLVLAILFTTPVAHGQDVHYNYERGANFSGYKTYHWVDAPSGESLPSGALSLPVGPPPIMGGSSDIRGISGDQLLDQDIKRAIDEQLAQKGLTKVEKNADLYVGYQAGVHEERSINLFGTGWGDRGFGGFGDGSIQGQTSSIPIGGLVVGLYDPAKKQLVWRGDATKSIELNKDPNMNYRNLQKAMAKLFKNYPPQAGK